MNWTWKIGILHGFGEALYQELAGNIRRITRPIILPNGQMVLAKSLTCMAGKEKDQQFPAQGLVVVGHEVVEDLAADADRAWNGSVIVPANNGAARLKLT